LPDKKLFAIELHTLIEFWCFNNQLTVLIIVMYT